MPTGTLGQPLLVPAGLFLCPRCGTTINTPRAQLVWTGALQQPLAGFCNRCEHQYQAVLGAPSTTTSGAANTAGATALTVAAGAAFSALGAFICIDALSADGGAELVQVSSAGSSTSIPIASTPLRVAHSAGAAVQSVTLTDLSPRSPNLSGG